VVKVPLVTKINIGYHGIGQFEVRFYDARA
jgi:hypothetical protein